MFLECSVGVLKPLNNYHTKLNCFKRALAQFCIEIALKFIF